MKYLALIGAVLALVGIVAAADYYEQASQAEEGLTPAQYVAGISGRLPFQGPSRNPRDYLPRAPEGWTERDFAAEDLRSLVSADVDSGMSAMALEMEINPDVAKGRALTPDAIHKSRGRITRVYEKDGALVAMAVSNWPETGRRTVEEAAMQLASANMAAMSGYEPVAVVKGVAWYRNSGLFGMEGGGAQALTARIGTLRLLVQSTATTDETRVLLERIRYDGLNDLLETPVEGIGSAAPIMGAAREKRELKRLAAEAAKARAAAPGAAGASLEDAIRGRAGLASRAQGMMGDFMGKAAKLAGQGAESLPAAPEPQREMATAPEPAAAQAPASDSKAEIKVNRLSGGGKVRAGGCGGTAFCRVGGD